MSARSELDWQPLDHSHCFLLEQELRSRKNALQNPSRLCWPELVFFGPWMSLRLRRKVFKSTNSRFESGGDHPQNIVVQRCEKRRLTITSFVFVPLGQRCVQHITARLSQDASSASWNLYKSIELVQSRSFLSQCNQCRSHTDGPCNQFWTLLPTA